MRNIPDRRLAVMRLTLLLLVLCADLPRADAGPPPPLPDTLAETGLFLPGTRTITPDALPYSPQYPLWSDGAAKRRWLYLPPGTAIDASAPDAWQFPPGTRLWKEFGYSKPVETRYIERLADGSWRFATYIWNDDGSEARLAPAEGVPDLPVRDAPDGIYAVPSREDCLACHEAAAVPVLGVGALQLSPDRDRQAPHAEPVARDHVDLRELAERGLLANLPPDLIENPPRIPALSANARAALGYLHGNCGHCHNSDGPLAELELDLLQPAAGGAAGSARTLATLVDQASEFQAAGIDTRVVPGEHASSMLLARMRSRHPLAQMPPLGTRVSDAEANELIKRWIDHDLQARQETPR
jgi:mono/diheme cytochrome c family protein